MKPATVKTGSQRVSSKTEIRRTFGHQLLFSKLHTLWFVTALAATTAHAQDRSSAEELEELIPQEVLEDSESWALRQVEGAENPKPVSDVPQVTLPPVDQVELDTPQADELTEALELPLEQSGSDTSFAATEDLALPSRPAISDVVRVDERLVLGFPSAAENFPEQRDFIARFKALSTIEALNSSSDNIAQLAARARADEELLRQLLRAYGYYDGRVIRSVGGIRPGEEEAQAAPQARFDVLPGTQYRFGAIDLGNADAITDAAIVRSRFGIKAGDPLDSDRILERKQALNFWLGETGYPFAIIAEPSLLIDHDRQEGDLTLPVEPGGQYRFAGVTSDKPEFLSSRHLQPIARFSPGDIYQRSIEQDLQCAVIASGLVSILTITPRETLAPTNDTSGEVMLDVELEPAKLRTIAGAVGYGTEDGFKVEASWEHRNLFPPEGALKLRGILGTREQLAGITFTRSNWRRRDQVLALDAYASDITTESVDARTVALRGSVERISNLLFQKPLGWSVGAEALLTDERNRVINGVARPRQTFRIASLFSSVTLDGSNDLLDPTQGYRVTLFIAPEASRSSGETSFYLRSQMDATYYQPLSDGITLAGRATAATIQGADTGQIAPSRRLYSGGGSSVRGYGYQAIGPANDFGEITGGRSLIELSAEARIDTGLFDGALQIVPFFDLGAVSIDTTPDFRFVKYGAGLGVRYKTGFGPIRVDLGVPINPEPQDSAFAVYVSLGQAF